MDKVNKNLSDVETAALKNLDKWKDLVSKSKDSKSRQRNTLVITKHTKYLEGIKSLLSDSTKFMQLPIDEDKWINYINLRIKLKDRFKWLKDKDKFSKKEFDR